MKRQILGTIGTNMRRVLTVLLLLVYGVLFAKTGVNVQIGSVLGVSCEGAPENALIAGSVGNIAVIVSSDLQSDQSPSIGFADHAPEWLHLKAGYKDLVSQEFVASPDLLELLNPQFFLSNDQVQANDALKNGASISKVSSMPVYYFKIQLPEELVDKIICVRAILSPPPYGQLRLAANLEACASIVAPCSENDRNLAAATHVIYAVREGNYELAVQIADSLIKTEWRSESGLSAAQAAASAIGRYDKSIQFLDLQYETYGTVGPYVADPVNSETQYQRLRKSLIDAIEKQK